MSPPRRDTYKGRLPSDSVNRPRAITPTKTPAAMNYEDPEGVKKYRNKAEALTSPFAQYLIQQCGLDRADGSSELVILDNACGTAVVTLNLYETLSPAAKAKLQVVCGDLSPEMVKSVQERIEESRWAGASARVVDAWVRPRPELDERDVYGGGDADGLRRGWTYRRTTSRTSSRTSPSPGSPSRARSSKSPSASSVPTVSPR